MNGLLSKCAIGCALVAASIAGTATVMSGPDTGSMPEMTQEEMEMMQRWMEFATPDKHHEKLGELVGTWNAEMTYWPEPGADPVVNQATSEARMILGGRYLVEEVRGVLTMGDGMPPMPFEGMAITGFDNHAKEWRTLWIDNMGTGFWTESGKPTTDMFMDTTGTNYDCMAGKDLRTRSTIKLVNDNTRLMTFYSGSSKNNMNKGMQIRYTRKR